MQIVTNGRNIELTDSIKDAVKQKLARLESHYDFIREIHVILEVEKNPRISDNQLAEATVHITGAVIRVEAASESLYTSLDRLVEKIDRSLQKHKSKLSQRHGKHATSIRHDDGALVDSGLDVDSDDVLDDVVFETRLES